MTIPDAVWGGLLLVGAAYETYALTNKRSDDTLSETTRRTFRVTTPVGRAVFAVAWTAFSTWFLGHVLWGWPFPLT